MKTSAHLNLGGVYTRRELQESFSIRAASIFTGIFRPSGHDSIWLFITEEIAPNQTQYRNRLNDDELEIDGQLAGMKDGMLINHEGDGLEVILFYRRYPREFPRSGFRYEGPFRYVRHEGTRPAHFYFRRIVE